MFCNMHLRLRSSTPVIDHILLALFMFRLQQCNFTCKCSSQFPPLSSMLTWQLFCCMYNVDHTAPIAIT